MKRILATLLSAFTLVASAGSALAEADPRIRGPITIDEDVILYVINDKKFTCHVTGDHKKRRQPDIDCSLKLSNTPPAEEKIQVEKEITLHVKNTKEGHVCFIAASRGKNMGAGISCPKF